LYFVDYDVMMLGDVFDVLVVMNFVVLKVNLCDLFCGVIVFVDIDEFSKCNLVKVGYVMSFLDDGLLVFYYVYAFGLIFIMVEVLVEFDLICKEKEWVKNMFVFGLLLWLYDCFISGIEVFLYVKFVVKFEIFKVNFVAL